MQEIRVAPTTVPLGGGDSGGGRDDNPPPASTPSLVHGWLLERLVEGDRVNRTDPAFSRAADLISDVMGDQITATEQRDTRKVVLNQIRKTINTHASMLTDIKPMWEWRTMNPNFSRHAKVHNDQLAVWWLQTFADLELTDAARYAATIGSSDVLLEYDRNYNGGDSRIIARDWRDTIPIRPERSHSIQDWEGVIFCEVHTAAKLRGIFPHKAGVIQAGGAGVGVGVFTRNRKLTRPEAQVGPLGALGGKGQDDSRYDAAKYQSSNVVLYRAFVRDRSVNLSASNILVGDLGANWSYWVGPGEPLYPRGRCILFTEAGILADGPNPYWHGRWPAARLSLQRWPWLMVGMPLAHDMRQLAQAINITTNDFFKTFSQWVNRGSVWGKNAPASDYARFDPTKPNWKLKTNNLVGTGFQMQDGPTLPTWSFQFYQFLFSKWDELSGTANLNQLLQLRQSPSADTLEKYMEAMTPEIRLEARQIEMFLREIAVMYIYNNTQFCSAARRKMQLGAEGLTLEDADYDPDTLVPAMTPGQKGYTPELDASVPRDERAKFYLGQFAFFVAPGSLIALHAMEKKMLYLQLARMGYMDIWTLSKLFEIGNFGEPPLAWLPKDLSEDEIAALPAPPPDPQTGQPTPPQIPVELRRPQTVIELLQAQQQLGIGQTENPAGRKASGQAPPKMEQKGAPGGGQRQVVSESR